MRWLMRSGELECALSRDQPDSTELMCNAGARAIPSANNRTHKWNLQITLLATLSRPAERLS
jgi:hypothetical protein